MIEIDGTTGEGGGQVLRTSLSMSLVTQQPFRMFNVRARRPRPGLMPQHLMAVRAAAEIGRASVDGAERGSRRIEFVPRTIRPGAFDFDIGTAGSAPLVLQTLLVPLSLAAGPSTVSITGGTHVPWSPCFHYLDLNWRPFLEQAGYRIDLNLLRPGFYPQGGGRIRTQVAPVRRVCPLAITERGRLRDIHGLSAVARLHPSIAQRQRRQALLRLAQVQCEHRIEIERWDSPGAGTILLIRARYDNTHCCFFSLGARGKPSEKVADEAVDAFEEFAATPGAVDPYLADQLLIPLVFADGESTFRTSKVTAHLITNAEVLRSFLATRIDVDGGLGEPGLVRVAGIGLSL